MKVLNRLAWSSRYPTTTIQVTSGVVARKIPKIDLNRLKSIEIAKKSSAKDPIGPPKNLFSLGRVALVAHPPQKKKTP